MKIYFKAIALTLAIITIISSCKKKNEPTPEPTPPYVANTATVTVTSSGILSAGQEVLFSPDKRIKSASWDFGDGSFTKGEDGLIMSHVYAASGTYSVTVWAADSTIKATKTISIGAAFHDFRYSGRHNVGDAITFQTTESLSAALLWDFGDGTTSSEVTPAHVYDSAGRYRVQLTVNGVAEPQGALYVRVYNANDTVARLTAQRPFRGCRRQERSLNSPAAPGWNFLLEDGGNGLEQFLGERSVRIGNNVFKYAPGQSGSGVFIYVAESNSGEQPAYLRYYIETDSLSFVYTTTGYSELYGKAPMAFEHWFYSSRR
jgi:chitodextrinase